MEIPVAEAISALNSRLATLLPTSASEALTPDILINPVRTWPAGIGGYVGLNAEPVGEIHARRIRAQVVIRVKADSLPDLGPAETSVTHALMGASRSTLRHQGILRISRDTDFERLLSGPDSGLGDLSAKDIRFDVDFEYLRLPEDASSIIDSISLDLLLNETGNRPRVLYNGDFQHDLLSDFDAFDDTDTNNGPSNWDWSEDAQAIIQTSAISGGSHQFNPSKRGTCLILRTPNGPLPDYWLLQANMQSEQGGMGLVFNFRDMNNYDFLILNRAAAYSLIGRKQEGSFSFAQSGGQMEGSGYTPGEDTSIRVAFQDNQFQVLINHQTRFTARVDESTPGTVGLLCRNNGTAQFRSLRWISL